MNHFQHQASRRPKRTILRGKLNGELVEQSVILPVDATVLSIKPMRHSQRIQGDHGEQRMYEFWYMTMDDPADGTNRSDSVHRKFWIIGTGHDVPQEAGVHLETFVDQNGFHIWHVMAEHNGSF